MHIKYNAQALYIVYDFKVSADERYLKSIFKWRNSVETRSVDIR